MQNQASQPAPEAPVLPSSLIAEKLFSEATDSSETEDEEGPQPLPALWKRPAAPPQDHQLPGGCAWAALLRGGFSSVLWLDAPLDGAEAAGVAEEEPTPLEVLMELCWMASL